MRNGDKVAEEQEDDMTKGSWIILGLGLVGACIQIGTFVWSMWKLGQ